MDMRLPNFQKEKNIKNNKLTQEEEKEVYKQNIQSRSTLHYILGLVVRWKQNLKYEKARRIARKKRSHYRRRRYNTYNSSKISKQEFSHRQSCFYTD